MNMKRMIMAAAMVVAVMGTDAGVGVTGVKVAQRYPWNGMVDIDYTVTADAADVDVYVFPVGTDNDRNCLLNMRTLSGDGATGAVKPGKHRMTWNAAVDQPKNYHTANFSVQMTAIAGTAPYLVIDLSGGPNAPSYPVRFSAAAPDVANDTCRTTELWLRLILPGTFMMGSPDTELGHNYNPDINAEDCHRVTISKAFYIGVFEVTQKQYELVMGSNPSRYIGDCRPVESVSYQGLRGAVAGGLWPSSQKADETSFFGKICAKTGLLLDLPTEAMWEYACRAGTTTAINNGKNLSNVNVCDEMSSVARYYYNKNDGKGGYAEHTKVGSYEANAWGLYDMHGNVAEWCLDWWQKNLGSADVSDPKGASSGEFRVVRGGHCFMISFYYGASNGRAVNCRSSYRSYSDSYRTGDESRSEYINSRYYYCNSCTRPGTYNYGWGFRVACFAQD